MNTTEYRDRYLTNPEYIDADGNVYDEEDLRESYDDMLDEEGPVTIGGLEYSVSRVLQEVDPIAYRCGMLDYQNTLEWDEWTENHEWIEDEDEDEDEDESCEDCAREDRPLFVGSDGLTYCDRHIENHEA